MSYIGDEKRDLIILLADGERTFQEIANHVGCSWSCVQRTITRHGAKARKRGPHSGARNPNSNWTEQQRQQVLSLYQQEDLSISDIAKIVERTHASVEKFLHRSGLNKRKAGAPKGKKNPFWAGGRPKVDYKKVWIPSEKRLVKEHRLVIERKLGRKLLPTEVVHHIDGNPLNNHEDNLEVLPSHSDHIKHHLAENKKQADQKN